jgi:D-lactate dehydrogenase (cytochrome)
MIRITDSDAKIEYIRDAANYVGSADIVYIPETVEEIAPLLRECYSANKPITISAARTGLTGGGVPLSGVLISTERLDKILAVNIENNTALLEPGVRIQNFHNELKLHNRIYPSNPTETWSTIGGNVATNASGAKTFRYGPTRNFVNYLELVLADGDEIHIKRGEHFAKSYEASLSTISGRKIEFMIPKVKVPLSSKNAAGFHLRENMDLIDLFIGSEGTLGLVKKIGLDILPVPEEVLSAVVFFDERNNLLNFVETLRNGNVGGLEARLIEYFDKNSLALLSDHHSDIPKEAVGAVWIEIEVASSQLDELMSSLYSLTLEHTDLIDSTWVATTDKEREKITQFRHNLPLSVNELLTKYGQQKIYTDTAVPVDNFRDYYNTMYEKLNAMGLDYVVFGHIGNCHLHANLFVKNEDDKRKAIDFYNEMVSLAIQSGGTFSAEHGVGKIKRPFMQMMYSEAEISGMKAIKKAFDPKLLLGQNTLFSDWEF